MLLPGSPAGGCDDIVMAGNTFPYALQTHPPCVAAREDHLPSLLSTQRSFLANTQDLENEGYYAAETRSHRACHLDLILPQQNKRQKGVEKNPSIVMGFTDCLQILSRSRIANKWSGSAWCCPAGMHCLQKRRANIKAPLKCLCKTHLWLT